MEDVFLFIEDGASEVEEPGLGGVIITLVDPVAFDGKPGLSGLVAEGLATPPTGLGRDEGFMFTLSEEAADSGVEAIDVLLVVNQLNRQSSNGQGNDKEIELLGWNWGQSSAGAGFDSVVALENGTSIQAKGAQSPAIGILSSRSGVIADETEFLIEGDAEGGRGTGPVVYDLSVGGDIIEMEAQIRQLSLALQNYEAPGG